MAHFVEFQITVLHQSQSQSHFEHFYSCQLGLHLQALDSRELWLLHKKSRFLLDHFMRKKTAKSSFNITHCSPYFRHCTQPEEFQRWWPGLKCPERKLKILFATHHSVLETSKICKIFGELYLKNQRACFALEDKWEIQLILVLFEVASLIFVLYCTNFVVIALCAVCGCLRFFIVNNAP